jgi:hypothetical protein
MPERNNNYNNSRERNADFRFEIVEHFGVVSTSPSGWTKELNRVSWNGKDPKFDFREWSPDHAKMHRGVTFTEEEAVELRELLDAATGGSSAEPLSA